LRKELDIPAEFPPEVLAEAAEAAKRVPGPEYVDRRDIEFVTIDPPSSLDLDQAVQIERRGSGYRVHYAIADLGFFIDPGSALDVEVNRRGMTIYGPDRRTPLHPPVLSEGAASLLPGQDRPAALWTIDLDAAGEIVNASVRRALVRSRAKLSYDDAQRMIDDGTADESLQLLKVVGQLRQSIEQKRGGVSLDVPEQEVEEDVDGDFDLLFRRTLPVEGWNAQISLLTGLAAAHMMRKKKVGILRTLPPADLRDVRRLRAAARALDIDWPKRMSYADLLRQLDSTNPKHAAFMSEATKLFRGAGYLAFDADAGAELATGADARHSAIAAEYAHVTAPLRRLVDRYGTEVCLAQSAGRPVPDWVRERLADLPEQMMNSGRIASKFERKCADVVEASLLADRVGQIFDGVVIEVDYRPGKKNQRGEVMLADPAILARVDGSELTLGEPIKVRLVQASVPDAKVVFESVDHPPTSNE